MYLLAAPCRATPDTVGAVICGNASICSQTPVSPGLRFPTHYPAFPIAYRELSAVSLNILDESTVLAEPLDLASLLELEESETSLLESEHETVGGRSPTAVLLPARTRAAGPPLGPLLHRNLIRQPNLGPGVSHRLLRHVHGLWSVAGAFFGQLDTRICFHVLRLGRVLGVGTVDPTVRRNQGVPRDRVPRAAHDVRGGVALSSDVRVSCL